LLVDQSVTRLTVSWFVGELYTYTYVYDRKVFNRDNSVGMVG